MFTRGSTRKLLATAARMRCGQNGCLSVCLRLLNIALSLKWRAIETEPRRQALSHNTHTHTREPTVGVCVRAFTPESVKLETET